jgi:protein-tyrosine-phosphatase
MPERLMVFVCSGNVCRSPMAEYLLRQRLGADSGWRVISAGVSAGAGMPASDAAVEALSEMDIDLGPHRSRPVTKELVREASMLVVMTATHYQQMKSMFPDSAGHVYLLKSFDPEADGTDVADPIGSSVDFYREIRDEISAALPGLIKYMKTFKDED